MVQGAASSSKSGAGGQPSACPRHNHHLTTTRHEINDRTVHDQDRAQGRARTDSADTWSAAPGGHRECRSESSPSRSAPARHADDTGEHATPTRPASRRAPSSDLHRGRHDPQPAADVSSSAVLAPGQHHWLDTTAASPLIKVTRQPDRDHLSGRPRVCPAEYPIPAYQSHPRSVRVDRTAGTGRVDHG